MPPAEQDEPATPVRAAIDGALAGTEDLTDVPVAEHVARFEAVRGALSDALTSIDEE
jgi:hypothetical protein